MNTKFFYIACAIIAECFIIYASVLVKMTAMSPINLGFYRITLALPVFFLLLGFYRRSIFSFCLRDMLLMCIAGIFFAFDLVFFNLALRHTSVANVNLMSSLVCFILLPIGFFFFHEKIKKSFLLGAIITISGVIILIKGKGSESVATIYGDFLAFLSVLCYGIFLSLVYGLRRKYGALEIMFFASLGSSITLFCLAAFLEGFEVPQNTKEWIIIAMIAFFGQIVGQGIFSFIVGKINTQTSSLLLLFSPVIAAIMGFLFLHEKLGLFEILGICIILLGVYFAKRETH